MLSDSLAYVVLTDKKKKSLTDSSIKVIHAGGEALNSWFGYFTPVKVRWLELMQLFCNQEVTHLKIESNRPS